MNARLIYWPAFLTVGLLLGVLFAVTACAAPQRVVCLDAETGATVGCTQMAEVMP